MNCYISDFTAAALRHADSTAFVDRNGTRKMSYRELDALRREAAVRLMSYGFDAGTPVLIRTERGIGYVAAYLAVLTAGYAAVPVSREYPDERIDFIVHDCGAKLIITDDFFRDLHVSGPGSGASLPDFPELSPDTTSLIVYTSGSTGRPKGIRHTHRSLCSMARSPLCLYNFEESGRAPCADTGAARVRWTGCEPAALTGRGPVTASLTPFSFMLFVADVLTPLLMGSEIHILSESVRKDASLIEEYFLRNKISTAFITPQLFKNLHINSPYFRRALVAGEVLRGVYSNDFEIINAYGSSETCLTFAFRLDKPHSNTPIGFPLPGCSYEISDDGELCVSGDFADGYINLPDKSRETFKPLSDGRVFYHTGDIVQQNDDGSLSWINRRDWMVKINGQRVETLEIEVLLLEMPGIRNAAVKAFTDNNGQTYLCAYFVPSEPAGSGSRSGGETLAGVSERDLRRSLSQKLPPYMMPRFFVKLDAMPVNANGKTDRLSLAPPSYADFKTEYIAPRDDTERALCEAFTAVLGCGRVGIADDFFALGGDSIKVLQLLEVLRKEHSLTLSTADILSAGTPEKIAAAPTAKRSGGDAPASDAPARPQSGAGIHGRSDAAPSVYPLTSAQRGVYFECMENPESTAYNIPFLLPLPASVDPDRFAAAVESAALLHPALFVSVSMRSGTPVMIPGASVFSVRRRSAASKAECVEGFVRPFDLENGPLFRFELAETPEGNFFLLDVHHLVFDGISLHLFLRQISDAYAGTPLCAEQTGLFDISEEEPAAKDSELYGKARDYFRSVFEGADLSAEILSDVPFPDRVSGCGIITLPAPDTLSADLVGRFAASHSVTNGTFFTAAFARAVSAFSGSRDACFTIASGGRHSAVLSDTVGMFVKILPLRLEIDGSLPVADFLRKVQTDIQTSVGFDCIEFSELASEYGVSSRTAFSYQSGLLSGFRLDGVPVMPEELPVNDCQSDILCTVLETASGFELRLHYRKNFCSEAMAVNIAETVFSAAAGFLNCESLGEADLLPERQRDFIDAINHTEKPCDRSETVNALIEKAIAERGDSTALIRRGRSFSFNEFDRITCSIAACIHSLGIGREDFVSVLTPRSAEGVLAIWGVVRSGAAFQVLDPTYPADRLNYMIADSGAKLLIADRTLRDLLTAYSGPVLFTDETETLPLTQDSGADGAYKPADARETVRAITAGVRPEDAFTVIYTSGTTGKPKGCVLENRNLAAFCRSNREVFGLDSSARVAAYASFGFDAGIMDVIGALVSGAVLCIVPDEIRLDMAGLDEFFCANSITHAVITTQVGRMFASETKCPTLRTVIVGGEKLVPFTPPSAFRFINGYGPCETMAYICHHTVTDNSRIQPIGRPSANTKLYVTDGSGHLVPIGAPGELWISGMQVGRGYIGLPEKTAGVFTANPFSSSPDYSRVYRTGDTVRLLPDGNLEFVGRRDGQIKVRGFRVELTEIEEVIRRYPGIKDAAVAAFDESSGGKYIAAYVAGPEPVDTEALKAFIASEKPAYMVPAAVMQIDAIPYNHNHKVDRRALPEPVRSDALDSSVPKTDTEKKVFSAVSGILGTGSFGINTDIFSLGLSSIGSLQLNIELGKTFGVPVKLSELRSYGTVAALARFIDSARAETPELSCAEAPTSTASEAPTSAASAAPGTSCAEALYPLMPNQTGVFLDSGMDKKTINYNIPSLFSLSDRLDPEKLRDAVCAAIDAHPYIKATLSSDSEGNVSAIRHDGEAAVVDIIRCESLPGAKELVRPFDLLSEKLYRAAIYITRDGNYFFLDVHHIISDGSSIALLLRDINAAYAGADLEPERFTGFDAALAEGKRAGEASYTEYEKYFEELLSGCNTDCLPGKCPEKSGAAGTAGGTAGSGMTDGTAGAGAGTTARSALTADGKTEQVPPRSVIKAVCELPESSSAISAFCAANTLTPNAFFNGVFAFTLARFLHADDVTYCTVYNGRADYRTAECFSMLVKTLPVRCAIDPKQSVKDFAAGVGKQLLDSMAADAVPFYELCGKYGIKSDIFFNYQGDNFNFDNIGGEKAQMIELDAGISKAPLSVEMFLENGVYRLEVSCAADFYCRAFAESFAEAFRAAAAGFAGLRTALSVFACSGNSETGLESAALQDSPKDARCASPDSPLLSDISLFPASEKKYFDEMNSLSLPYEKIPAHCVFERQAEAHPEKTAVRALSDSLSYGELNMKANAVANTLIKLGAGKGEIIGLVMERSELVPAVEIGIMKAGCAFLPMLPSYPDDRIDYCLKDAGCRFAVLSESVIEEKKALFAQNTSCRALSAEAACGGTDVSRPEIEISQSDLAYCIYTSGSTGTPKGVMIEQHNLSNFVQTADFKILRQGSITIAATASISFDMSITETFLTLCRGGTVYIASEDDVHNTDKLLSVYKEQSINAAMMTPSLAQNLLSIDDFRPAMAALKGIVLGAEAIPQSLISKLKELNPDMLVENGYGPTECTQVCSSKLLEPGCNVTIGRPFPNAAFYVMDESGHLLPRFAMGELLIGGECVCRGYVGLPEKNKASFTEIDGKRAYRTGDLVRINADNEAEFFGRTDNQVKIRGFRIELGEIESVIQNYEGVTRSRVIVKNNGSGDFLAAYFTASSQVDINDLTAFMKKSLTSYMIPSAVMQLDKMPITANGKLDVKALPEIRPAARQGKKRAPKKSVEAQVLDVFKGILGTDEVYADDNFFEIGGTSLTASRAVMQLKAAGHKIEYQDIFDHQSAEELAEYLEGLAKAEAEKAAAAAKKAAAGAAEAFGRTDETIAEVLKYNAIEYASETVREPLGTVLLTGATGFLGVHVLKALMEIEEGRIICIMRKGNYPDIMSRLKSTLVYYFEESFDELIDRRLTLLEGDITDDNLCETFAGLNFDTLINCAACVKHYANDNSIEFINVHGVENLIKLTKAHGAKMIQISTTSVSGAHTAETYKVHLKMYENQLFVVDDMNNQYGQSKYRAELKMYEAIHDGMRGKVIRMGNIMGRFSDGEFQINMRTNAFLNALRGFVYIGKCPFSHATDPMNFSPVDCSARAIVLLAGTNDKFTCFNADSRAGFDELKLMEAVNRCGLTIKPVNDDEYYADFYRIMADPAGSSKVSALLTNDRPDIHIVETDNRFSVNVLYRLGFTWPFVSDEYLENIIRSLDDLGFFSVGV